MNTINFLIGHWVGNIYGTHPSNIFVEFQLQNDTIIASIKSAAPNSSDIRSFIGKCVQNENIININLHELINNHQTENIGIASLKICSNILLEGEFELDIGTKGVIRISKFLMASNTNTNQEPPQIIAKEYFIPYPLRIYKNDIEEIINRMKEVATSSGIVIVSEQTMDGTTVRKYAAEYLKTEKHQTDIQTLSFTSQVNIENFTNTLTLNLNRNGASNIISQSNNFLWSHATPTLIKEFLEKRKSTLLSIYRRYGLEQNNGITEGFHRKMKLIQRRAYGFRNFENYRLRVRVLCA